MNTEIKPWVAVAINLHHQRWNRSAIETIVREACELYAAELVEENKRLRDQLDAIYEKERFERECR